MSIDNPCLRARVVPKGVSARHEYSYANRSSSEDVSDAGVHSADATGRNRGSRGEDEGVGKRGAVTTTRFRGRGQEVEAGVPERRAHTSLCPPFRLYKTILLRRLPPSLMGDSDKHR